MPLETIKNHCIKIKPSLKLLNFIINNMKNNTNIPVNISVLQNNYKNKHRNYFLSVKDIRWLKLCILEQQYNYSEKIYIHELFEGVHIILPEYKITLRNAKLEARIKKLQAQQNTRDYKAMTKDVDIFRKHLPEDTIAFQMKLINKQLIAVAQFVFSVIAGFTFGFIGVELIIGNLDFGFRLLLGIICALIVALAEIYFLAKKLSEQYDISSECIVQKLHQE
ncbi:PREDICTED: uncharacterized protein LOC105361518 [Ceratosolen solmsi marchali]|uniref:Uncharacterized protein LOC105361518 n=1 Tax=Ceratosolen solmsi marchali TaxID=326594 RepID=A0AAJ7DUM7_9HYME|nr:PREDICTED: uncharacterized protein LOC105361518 [Ceratosolen solmsi marchali]